MKTIAIGIILCMLIQWINGNNQKNETAIKDKRLMSVFNVVSFPNENCQGATRNGTCFTADECNDLGGNNDGSCASGFGVCCTFVLSCGGSSAQNCTYIEMAAFTNAPVTNPCIYSLSRSSDSVCRIRLDFTSFNIEPPQTGKIAETGVVSTEGSAIGDCKGDSMTVTSPGLSAPPIICGFNTGQHIFLDTAGDIHSLAFAINSTNTAFTRQWSIKATHYECGSTLGGPPGCLQYHTATSGSFASFNFDTTATTIGDTPNAHLSNQNYEVCFRRASGNCIMCFVASISGIASMPANQASFGLSIASANSGIASTDTRCIADYIEIPDLMTSANALMTTITALAGSRVCGRAFNTEAGTGLNATLCTRSLPFRARFVTDENEGTATIAAIANELGKAPGGIIGFSLNYAQIACN